jgi:hypothetical protein
MFLAFPAILPATLTLLEKNSGTEVARQTFTVQCLEVSGSSQCSVVSCPNASVVVDPMSLSLEQRSLDRRVAAIQAAFCRHDAPPWKPDDMSQHVRYRLRGSGVPRGFGQLSVGDDVAGFERAEHGDHRALEVGRNVIHRPRHCVRWQRIGGGLRDQRTTPHPQPRSSGGNRRRCVRHRRSRASAASSKRSRSNASSRRQKPSTKPSTRRNMCRSCPPRTRSKPGSDGRHRLVDIALRLEATRRGGRRLSVWPQSGIIGEWLRRR